MVVFSVPEIDAAVPWMYDAITPPTPALFGFCVMKENGEAALKVELPPSASVAPISMRLLFELGVTEFVVYDPAYVSVVNDGATPAPEVPCMSTANTTSPEAEP